MTNFQIDEWFELDINQDKNLGVLPKFPKKLKFLADQNIPAFIVVDLANHFSIKSVFDFNLDGHPDENIREAAKKEQRILFTTDKDFWDEKKHPIKKCFGIVCTEAGPGDIEKIYASLARFYVMFAKHFPNDWWHSTKAFIKNDGFIIRLVNSDSVIEETEYKFKNGKILYRIKV